MRSLRLVLTVALVTVACGGTMSRAAVSSAPAAPRPSDLVTADDIRLHGGSDLGQVLTALRPGWFRHAPTIYVDGHPRGTLSSLRELPVAFVEQVRYYSASQAQDHFGLDHSSRVIEVIRKR